MSFQHLERHDERIRDEVGIDGRVEHLHCTVVGSAEEEREARRECYRSDGSRVVTERKR